MFKVSNSNLKIFLGTFLGAACGLMLPTANANIIDSTYGAGAGSFEFGAFVNGGGTPAFTGPDYMALPSGSTVITGWTVGGVDGVDWLTTPTFGADTGVHSVDLQNQALTPGSITTVIPTISGDVYRLSFGAAAVAAYGNATGEFSAGSLVNQAFTAAYSATLQGETFTPFSFLFTATDSTTSITFNSALVPVSVYGPVIDSVSVDPISSVPEPSSIALLLLGGGVLCARVLTRRHCGARNA